MKLKAYLFIAIVMLAATLVCAAPPTVAITGPTQVNAGSAVFLQAETDAVAVEWIVFPASASNNFVGLTLYQGMTPDGKPILKHCGFFSSPDAGTYTFVLVGTKQDQLGKATHTLTNGKIDPKPDPPNPSSKWQVLFFHNADDLDNYTLAQRDMLSGLTFRSELIAKGHQFLGSLDPTAAAQKSGCVDGQCPVSVQLSPKLQAWFDAVQGKTLPCVAMAPLSGGNIVVYPLPVNSQALFALLEGQK